MPTWARFVFAVIAFLFTAALTLVAYKTEGRLDENPYAKTVGMFWAIAPPIWFLLEWRFYSGPFEGRAFEIFKLSQERAKDLWLGVVVALIILLGLKA